MSAYDLGRRRRAGAVRPHPIFLAFVAVTALGAWLSWRETGPGSRLGDVGVFLLVIGGWVVSLCVHEFGHAYTAYRAGDRGVEARGYLTLNPLRYAHPVLSLLLPLLFLVQGGIGLPGGAVYLHPAAFRSRAMQSLAALVGPASNAAFAAALLALVGSADAAAYQAHPRLWFGLAFLAFLQLTAAVLNLLPIPGLDGYAVIEPYLDRETTRMADKIKPWGLIGVIVLLQVATLNRAFFDLVYRIYAISGVDGVFVQFGRELFRFWAKNPL